MADDRPIGELLREIPVPNPDVRPSSSPGISHGTPNAWGRDEGSVSFLSTLNYATLSAAREVVRRKFMIGWPAELQTDRECDRIIEAMGPESMAEARHLGADPERLAAVQKKRMGRSTTLAFGEPKRKATPNLVLSTSIKSALEK